MAERIQRKRTKGWTMPEGAVYVGRSSRWGNPYSVKSVDRIGIHPFGYRVLRDPSVANRGLLYATEADAAARAVELFRAESERSSWAERIAELAGQDLACWCPLDQPCHADVLLRLANGGES